MLIKIGSALIDPEEIVAIIPDLGEKATIHEEDPHIRIDFKSGGSVWIDSTMDEAEAALIDAGVVTDLTADPEQDTPAFPLTDWEAEKLCELGSDGYKYLARDKDGKLYAFWHKPKYGGFYWDDPDRSPAIQIDGFLFISEDDEEPTEISRLLENLS